MFPPERSNPKSMAGSVKIPSKTVEAARQQSLNHWLYSMAEVAIANAITATVCRAVGKEDAFGIFVVEGLLLKAFASNAIYSFISAETPHVFLHSQPSTGHSIQPSVGGLP
jgi:hypothetical protein